jgi:hypothetical protein
MSFSSSRTIQRPNDHQLVTLPINPYWLPTMNMNLKSQPILITQPYATNMSYNDISSCPFYSIMTIQFYPLCPMVIEQFYP